MIISVTVDKKLSEKESKYIYDSYIALGWQCVGRGVRAQSPYSDIKDSTNGYSLQWLHNSEPNFPDNARYSIIK